MHICLCRQANAAYTDATANPDGRVNTAIVQLYLKTNPETLTETWAVSADEAWAVVSENITGRKMVCGRCEDEGNDCIEQTRVECGLTPRAMVWE